MDEKTRFHMVSVITKTREIEDAKKAFRKSKEVGNKKPRLMVTDGLPSYKKAFIVQHIKIETNNPHALAS